MRHQNNPERIAMRNYDIDFFKLYYAFMIVGYHFYLPTQAHFVRGNSAVSYFFLVSGLLLFDSFEKASKKHQLKTPNQFFLSRLWRFLPGVLISYLFTFIIKSVIIQRVTLHSAISSFVSRDLWEILLIKMNGMNADSAFFNSPVWSVSSIFLVGCVFWCFLYTCPKLFYNLLLPLSLLVGFGFYYHQENQSHYMWNGFTTAGTLRAWLLMGLGYYCLRIAKHLQAFSLNRKGMTFVSVIEILCHLLVLYNVNHYRSAGSEWLNIILYTVSAAVAFSGVSYISTGLSGAFVSRFLGDISFGVFLIHRPLISLLSWYYGSPDYISHLSVLVLLLIVFTPLFILCSKSFQILCLSTCKKIRHVVSK